MHGKEQVGIRAVSLEPKPCGRGSGFNTKVTSRPIVRDMWSDFLAKQLVIHVAMYCSVVLVSTFSFVVQ